jgi:hypothetical protein
MGIICWEKHEKVLAPFPKILSPPLRKTLQADANSSMNIAPSDLKL